MSSENEEPSPSAARSDRWLTWLLRAIGVLDLLAFAAVVMPQSLMSEVHASLDIGIFPTERIVGYLARTASMFYGFCGVLLLYLASDVARYRDMIRFIAGCGIVAGIMVLGIDLAVGMPAWWILFEGPCCGLLAAMVWRLARKREA